MNMVQVSEGLEAQAAQFVVGLDAGALTPEVRQAARWLMQDQIGVQVGCARLPWSQTVLEFTRAQGRPGKARVAAHADRLSAGDAAFVNGSFGHGFEYDDAHRASSSHPGCTVVPLALAIGEEIGASMGEVLVGMVAGYEVYTRIGVLAAPELLERGFHPHAMLANFGAAAVAAKMYGVDEETTRHALSIAMSHCSGTTEYTSSGGSVKRVHAGIGAFNGIRAAQMARAGITGPTRFLTGNKGFYRTFLQKEVAGEGAFAGDAPMQIERVWIKPHCCCGCNHAYIDAARRLSARAGEIEKVVLGIQAGADVVVGNRNENAFRPTRIEHLQYSLPFQVALALLGKGNGFEVHQDFLEGRLDLGPESDVARMAGRIEIVRKPELDAGYPGKWVGDAMATFRDGTSEHVFVEDSVGTVENPVSEADRAAKFRDLTRRALGEARSERLLATLGGFEDAMPAAELTALYAE
jgi:2-methylcitrate dehydratase PrpD